MKQENIQLIKSLFSVFAITFLAKAVGFVREIIYGSQLGVTAVSDNFVMAQTIPFTLYAIVTQAFRTTYIPNLFKIKKEHGKEAGAAYTGNYLVSVLATSAVFFILLFIFAKQLTLIFAGGFTEADIDQTVYMTRFISVTVLVGGAIDVLNGYLQSDGQYNIGASLTIFSNIIFCLFLYLYPLLGIKALLLASIVSKLVELLIVGIAVLAKRLKICFRSWKYFMYTVGALKNSIPVLFGSVITDVGNLIDKRFATMLITGTVSALNYAHKVEWMIVQLFSVAIGAVLFPELSKLSNDKVHFTRVVKKGIRYILIVMIPIAAATITISTHFVSVLFQRGAFDTKAVELTSQCLAFYAPAIVFSVGYEFLSKACFALHDTRTPIKMSVIGTIVNVVFNALLINTFKHQGLAFATSLSMLIAFGGVYIVLKKRLELKENLLWSMLVKIFISVLIMGVAVKAVSLLPLYNKYASFILCIVVGALMYFVSLLLLKCQDVYDLFCAISARKR